MIRLKVSITEGALLNPEACRFNMEASLPQGHTADAAPGGRPAEPPLTKGEQDKLCAEEQFRATIRQWIEDQKPRKSGLQAFGSSAWAFANSAFFLWVLSTVVVTFGTIWYTNWRQSKSEERLRQQQTERLDMEIASRLQYVATSWPDSASTFSARRSSVPDTVLRNRRARLVFSLMRPDSANFPIGVFPEFVPRPLPSLIWELRHELVDSAQAKPGSAFAAELDSALATSVRLFGVYAEIRTARVPIPGSINRRAADILDVWFRTLEREPGFQGGLVKELRTQMDIEKGVDFRNLNLPRWKCPFGTDPAAPHRCLT